MRPGAELAASTAPGSFRHVAALYDATLDADESERRRILAGVDEATRAEVEELLALAVSAPSVLSNLRWSLGGLDEGTAGMLLEPETRVGEFTITGVLGRGGSGIVYRARQDNPARDVALKVPGALFTSPAQAARFRREARTLALLQHPGIAQVLWAGVVSGQGAGTPCFAMELVNGVPITEFARAVDTRERLDLLAQVCDALEHAHQRGVVHRDLKPSNILVEDASHGGRARVLDFGVASVTDPDGSASLQGDAGVLVGTPSYMSPEQLAGRVLDTRSDLYSLGVVAYEVLTGSRAFEGCDDLLVAIKTRSEKSVARPSMLRRDLRGDIEAVLLRALEDAPERRYQSAGALAADLRAAARREPVTARPPGALRAARVFVRHHKVAAAAALAGGIALLAGAGATAWQAVRAVHAEARATRRSERLAELTDALLAFSAATKVTLGATESRDVLLNQMLPTLEKLAADAGEDIEVRRQLAATYIAMGRHLGHPRGPNLGQKERAIEAYRAGIALMENDPGTRAEDIAPVYAQFAEMLMYYADSDADRTVGLAMSAYREWARQHPDDVQPLFGMCCAAQTEVRVQRVRDSREQVIGLLRQRDAEISRLLSRIEAKDAPSMLRAAECQESLGGAWAVMEENAESIAHLERGLRLAQLARGMAPERQDCRVGVANLTRNLAFAYSGAGRFQEAVTAFRAAMPQLERLLADAPGRTSTMDVLATSHGYFAEALAGAGMYAEACAEGAAGAAMYVSMMAADPGNMHLVSNASLTHLTVVGVFAGASESLPPGPELDICISEGLRLCEAGERLTQKRLASEPDHAKFFLGKFAEARARLAARAATHTR